MFFPLRGFLVWVFFFLFCLAGRAEPQCRRTALVPSPSVMVHGQACRVQHAHHTLELGGLWLQLRIFSLRGFFFLPCWESRTTTQEDSAGFSPFRSHHDQARGVQHACSMLEPGRLRPHIFPPTLLFFFSSMGETCGRADPQCKIALGYFAHSTLSGSQPNVQGPSGAFTACLSQARYWPCVFISCRFFSSLGETCGRAEPQRKRTALFFLPSWWFTAKRAGSGTLQAPLSQAGYNHVFFSSHGFSSSLGEACGKVDLQHKRTAPFFFPLRGSSWPSVQGLARSRHA